jgi:hypothetical protein
MMPVVGMERGHDIGPIVDHEVRLVIERCLDVAIVGLGVFALDRENRNAGVDQCGRDIVLRGERVARAEDRVGSAGLECECEIGRFGGDMRTAEQAQPFERLLLRELITDLPKDRHFSRSPIDAPPPIGGQRRILNIEIHRLGGHSFLLESLQSCLGSAAQERSRDRSGEVWKC